VKPAAVILRCTLLFCGVGMLFPAATMGQSITQPPNQQQRISNNPLEFDTGMISIASKFSVKTTSARLVDILRREKLTVFADIDHQANANSVKLALRPTHLIIFGNAQTGTQLMHENQTIGLDLPLKYLVWESVDHQVYISWNNPYYLAKRHGIPPQLELLSKMSSSLYSLAERASKS
jgi:uncharacterized protein (DUF302 family)